MSQTTSANQADAPLTGAMLWAAAIILAAANFIAVLDMTIANVSVPNIAGALGATTSQGTWVITSYAVAEAITVHHPSTGRAAARRRGMGLVGGRPPHRLIGPSSRALCRSRRTT